MNKTHARLYAEVWCRLAGYIWSWGLICILAAPGAFQQGYEQGEGHVVACRGSPDGSWNQMSIYLAERKLFFPYGHVLEKLPYKLLVQSSLRLMSLYSLLGLYFQDFSGKIKPRKNTPSRPGWDDCMINVSHKARLMLLWHLWENLLVSTPTLVLVQCLIPKPNTCFLDF